MHKIEICITLEFSHFFVDSSRCCIKRDIAELYLFTAVSRLLLNIVFPGTAAELLHESASSLHGQSHFVRIHAQFEFLLLFFLRMEATNVPGQLLFLILQSGKYARCAYSFFGPGQSSNPLRRIIVIIFSPALFSKWKIHGISSST